ncbi:MAG: ABC transporter permease [Gemmatimonadetes bacterium]|nr:ABC transporter permease [Gemmatimonadota bacterium]
MQQDRSRRYLQFFGPRPDADVEDEIAFHLEARAQELAARGLPLAEAREEARRRFGDRTRVEAEMRRMEREKSRRAARLEMWRDWGSDLTFVRRSLMRQPLFTIAAVLTLGLSIGVNTAIFSAVNAFLLKPLPVRDADRQMVVATMFKKDGITGSVSYPLYREVKALPVFEDAVSWLGWEVALRRDGNTQKGFVLAGSGNYLTALGVQVARGRGFTEADAATRAPVVVITDSYWAREFGRAPAAVGATLYLNDVPFTVIGVLPAAFTGTQPLIVPQLMMPVESMASFYPAIAANMDDMSWGSFRILARTKAGVTPAQLEAAMGQYTADLEQRYPREMLDSKVVAAPETRARPDLSVSRIVPWIAAVFFGMVGLAVLVACANVTNLLLARAAARRSEIAVRAALGAARGRVIRLLLTESVVIGILSLGVAYLLARFSIQWFNNLDLAIDVPISFGLEMDWRVFGYAAAISLAAGVIAGLAPAVMGSRAPVSEVLRESGRSGAGSKGRARFRNGLVIAQVAVSFVLLVSGGLFMRSARGAANLDIGFRRERLLVSQMDLSLHRLDSVQTRRTQDQLLERLAALPNVEAVGLGSHIPLGGNNYGRNLYLDTRPTAAPQGMFQTFYATVSPGYIPALGLRLREGRDLLPTDDDAAPRVAVVNRALAEALWPGEGALGKRFRLDEQGPEVEVVGLIENAQYLLLGEAPRPFAYFPIRQSYRQQTFIFVRTRPDDPLAAVPDLRRVVTEINPSILLSGTRSMATHLDHGIALFFVNMGATLATAIGLLGLLQTVVGLYGVLSYTVAQRAREFGIRQALGASAGSIVGQVLRQGSVLCGTGIAAGLAIAIVLTRSMSSLLYGVSPLDALAFGGALLIVGVVAFASSYLPARRASRVAPATAIRAE